MPSEYYDEDEDQEFDGQSSSMQQLRKAYNRMERENKALKQENDELVGFRGEVLKERKDKAIASSFEEVGLNPKHAKLFQALNPEVEIEQITPQSVAAFAAEYALVTTEGGEVAAPEPTGYAPVTTGQASKVSALSRDEWIKLAQTDQLAAQKAWEDGRVDLSGIRAGLGPSRD